MGFTDDEIKDLQSEQGKSETRGANAHAAEARDRANQAGDSQAGGLESYTEQDLAARDEAQRLSAETRAKQEKAADDKARADAEERANLDEDSSAYDIERASDSVQDVLGEFDSFYEPTPLRGEAAMRAQEFTEEEIREAIQSQDAERQDRGTQPRGQEAGREADRSQDRSQGRESGG